MYLVTNFITEFVKMTVLNITVLYIALLLPSAVICVININHTNTSNIIIEFQPYISVLDVLDEKRYGIEGMVPLISKVASRFTKIYIELFYNSDLVKNLKTDLFLSPFAVARYNCKPTTKRKIKLFVQFRTQGCSCASNTVLADFASNFSDQVEQECNQTMDTIFLEKSKYPSNCQITNCPQIANLSAKYNWGAWMSSAEYCEKTKDVYEFTNNPSGVGIAFKENILPRPLLNCNPYPDDQILPLKFFHKISLTNTGPDNIINMTRLVETWKYLFEDKDKLYILSEAFDTFSPNGWWYLVSDPSNKTAEEYVFEERAIVASKVDYEENPQNFQWLRKREILSQNWTGIIYSGRVPYEVLTGTFCQILITDNEIVQDLIRVLHTSNTFVPACESALRVSYVINEVSTENLRSLLAYESKYIRIQILVKAGSNDSLIENLKALGVPYGYIIDLEACTHSWRPHRQAAVDAMMNPQSSRYVFTYEEGTIYSAATRMFRYRKLLLKKCRQYISTIRNTSTQVEFAMSYVIPYKSKHSDFESSPLAMQNYVKYIYLLNKWAQEHEKVVFLGSDSNSVLKWTGTVFHNDGGVGWFSFDELSRKSLSKPEQALKLSLLVYPEQSGRRDVSLISSNQVFVVVGISLTVCTAFFVLGIYLLRRYYQGSILTQDEVEDFFRGNEHPENHQNDVHNLPYDRAKYEIPKENFIIATDATLGSGEFGKVSRGKISTANGEVNVAIKTTNPQKLHKTMLNGLLSEIKVLAHVGKHANITQLIGANTENIADGKVFIFLELCHLDSLEKFLMSMRTTLKTPVILTTEQNSDMEMRYVNTASNKGNILDSSLSKDFYRWSIEICNGMAFLAQKHVVHADLATRNVLLNLRREAKICDFGLSRRMYNYTSYVKTHQEPLPWKWMAPEALLHMQFNEKTDVWAYGITLWEIYSLGCTPFAGLSWDINFVGMLENGLKPSEPEYDDKDMYNVMKNCWKVLPERRPIFSEILSSLTSGDLEDGDN